MAIANGSILRITAGWQFQGEDAQQNVFWVRCDDTGAATQEDLILGLLDWIEDVYNPVLPQISTQVQTSQVSIYNMTSQLEEYVGPWATIIGGGDGGNCLPPGVTAMVRGRVSVKKTEGRKYFPVFGELQQDAGVVGPVALANMVTATSVYINPFLVGLFSQFTSGIVRTSLLPTLAFVPFISGQTNAGLDYQRRRKAGVGE